MSISYSVPSLAAVVLTMFIIATPPIQAGTDAGLVFEPWGKRQHLELNGSALFEQSGQSKGPAGGSDLGINIYHEDFRLRLFPDDPHQLAFGSDVTDIHIIGNNPTLGPRLVDQSYAVGFKFGQIAPKWTLGMVAGVGYSGSTPYVQGTSFYAKGALVAVRKLDDETNLAMMLNYNGNRPWLPDWPIPTIVWQHVEGQKFALVLGLPVAAIHWMPTDRWTIDAGYTPPTSINLNIAYEFIKNWSLYASYEHTNAAFHRDGTDPDRRIFFEQQHAEAGVQWIPAPMVHLAAAGGFAFDQTFSTGWDTRDTTTLVALHDEPYVRVHMTLYF